MIALHGTGFINVLVADSMHMLRHAILHSKRQNASACNNDLLFMLEHLKSHLAQCKLCSRNITRDPTDVCHRLAAKGLLLLIVRVL